jgi:hypothetical protein
MRSRLALAAAAAALLAACGVRKAPEETPGQAPAAAPAASVEVAAIDEFGPLAGEVADLAFWIHPQVPFNSLVIAATTAGLFAFNIEDGAPVAQSEGFAAQGVALYYHGVFTPDAGASASRARAVLLAADDAFALRAFAIDNESRAFTPLATPGAPPAGAAICAGPQARLPARLAVIDGAALRLHDVQLRDDALAFAPAGIVALPARGVACAIDPADGALYTLLETGDVLRRLETAEGVVENVFAAGAARPADIALARNAAPEGADDDACCGEILVFDRAGATVRVFDMRDGGALGAFRLKSSFDVAGVAAATAFGAGGGNFGAVYRDGVVALATDGAAPALRLTPLNGVMEALGRPVGAARDPRKDNPRVREVQCADPGLAEDQMALCAGSQAFALPRPEIALPE